MKHPVSGYMICLNEERGIEAAMRSILLHVDDLFILDGGSTDNTLNIIRSLMDIDQRITLEIMPQLGGRYQPEWREPWRRNYCAQRVKHNWVLTIDGDELLDDLPEDYFREADQSLILNTLNLLNRKEYIEQYHTDEYGWIYWYPDPHVRFFDRTRFDYNDTPLHCFLKDTRNERAILSAEHSNHDIWHYHGIIKEDRQWNHAESRAKLVVHSLTKPLPFHDGLMRAIGEE